MRIKQLRCHERKKADTRNKHSHTVITSSQFNNVFEETTSTIVRIVLFVLT